MAINQSNLVFSDFSVKTLPIVDSDARFPVRRIYCVGKNYLAHVKEMDGDVNEPPFFFQKPSDAIVQHNGQVPYPPRTSEFHYEAELVVAIGKEGRNIPATKALEYVFGYATGIDLTRRDLQNQCMDKGLPWEVGKSFDSSAPVGSIYPVSKVGHPNGRISLRVNGQVKQDSALQDMIWDVPTIISNLSGYYDLQPGDIIFTGTPEGVGAAKVGDRIEMRVEGFEPLVVTVSAQAAQQ